MIAVDTNVLVYAHREDSPHHRSARMVLEELATGSAIWAIPWPCLHEFLAVVTHPRIYRPPTAMATALEAVGTLAALANLRLLREGPQHLKVLSGLLGRPGVAGPRVHDARIAALCLAEGVSQLWTADRDFSWFPELTVHNPLV